MDLLPKGISGLTDERILDKGLRNGTAFKRAKMRIILTDGSKEQELSIAKACSMTEMVLLVTNSSAVSVVGSLVSKLHKLG